MTGERDRVELDRAELVCVHRWFDAKIEYYDAAGTILGTMKKCLGMCQSFWKDKDPEPRVIVARLETKELTHAKPN